MSKELIVSFPDRRYVDGLLDNSFYYGAPRLESLVVIDEILERYRRDNWHITAIMFSDPTDRQRPDIQNLSRFY